MNVLDPESPYEVGNIKIGYGYAWDIYVSGNYAYVADSDDGLVIVDVSDPSNPSIVGQYNTAGWAHDVYVSGNYAYVADYHNGLVIVNVSNKSNPSIVKNIDTEETRGVYVSGDYAYIADGKNGLVIVDISSPWMPNMVSDMIWMTFCGLSITW